MAVIRKKVKALPFKVSTYVNTRPTALYNRHIRVIDSETKKYLGTWVHFADERVERVVVTEKFLFIYI